MTANDDGIKKMARFLREGASMLDIACPLCNNPVFQLKNGEKACVVCERKIVFNTELDASRPGEEETLVPGSQESKQPPCQESPSTNVMEEVRAVCLKKLAFLLDELEHAAGSDQIFKINQCILQLFSILDRVKFS